ncbi:Type I secretion system ATP-binding protein PrsD [Serratia marcescens]|nr:type I secretion system ATPase family protein [Serratia marcescens]CAI1073174.1 Type I secretion system ATP-binding protein PrsD [Serratia marcescens]CAI1851212.1 Type I secretion system ATP-binding protein PrsD [Serratia marcescens]
MSVLAAYRRGFWGIALFTAVINLLMLAPALYMLQVYDRVLPSGNRMTLAMLTLMVVGLYLFMGLLEWVRSQVVIRLGAQMDMRLNQRVYDAAFETNLKTGNPLAGQALNDLTNLRQFATGNALFAFFDAPWFPVYLLVVFLLHPWLGALASAGVIVLVLLAWLNQRVSQAPLAEAGRVALSATQQANGNLRNAEAIAAMGMLTDLRLRWLRQHQQFLLLQNRASEKIAAVTAWSKTVRLALQSLMLGCGALLAVSGDITPGMMIAGSILIGRVLGPIDQLIGAWKQWSSARQSLQRLEVMLAANPPRIPSLPLPAPGGALTVSQLTASAPGGTAPVLHGVSFRLEAGEVLGVIGASGSGKTLLMRQLVGALTPISGDVRLDGADIQQWDKQQLGPHIGYLPQDIQLFAGTLTDNIARFGQVDAEKVVAAAALAGVHQLILHLPKGYETELGEGGSGLSGGQRQRVALARAVWISGAGGVGRTECQPRSRRGRGAAAGDRSAEGARHHYRVGDPQTGDPGDHRQITGADRRPGAALRPQRRHPEKTAWFCARRCRRSGQYRAQQRRLQRQLRQFRQNGQR